MENKGIFSFFACFFFAFMALTGCGNPPVNVIVGNGSGQGEGQDFELSLPNGTKIRSIGQERECIGDACARRAVRRVCAPRDCDPCAPDGGATRVNYDPYSYCSDECNTPEQPPAPSPVTINNNVTCGSETKAKPAQPKPVQPPTPSIPEGCRDY